MAGRPMMRRLEREIQEAGGDQVIFDMIAAGDPMRKIAERFNVSRRMIYSWIHKTEEREKAWELAKVVSAHALVDDGMDILDALAQKRVPPENAEVTLAKARSRYRQWLAGMRNRDAYGKKDSGVNVNVNFGDLHLEALRQHGQALPADEGGNEIEEAQFELLEDGE